MASSRFSWRGVIPQLFTLVVLPLAGLTLFIAFIGLRLHQQAMRALVGERDQQAARATASALTEQLNHRSAAIRGLAQRAAQGASRSELEEALTSSDFLLDDFDAGLAIFDRNGVLLTRRGDQTLWDRLGSEIGNIYQSLSDRKGQVTFATTLHPASQEPIMLVSTPMQGQELVVAGAFSPGAIVRQTLAGMISGEGETVFVVDSDRRVLYKMGGTQEIGDLAAHSGVSEALRGESGASYIQTGGSEHVVAYTPVEPVGWALVIDEPWEELTSPLLRTTENAPLVLIPLLVLALVAIWFGTRWIVQPLQSLESWASDLAWGNYETIEEPVGGIAEIRRLQSELAHLARKVKAAQQGLRGYIGAITLGQEEERRRLARELHDDTLQSLIALNQRVQLVRLSLGDSPESQSLEEIQNLTEETIQNLRRLSRALRPIYLEDLGLGAALEMLSREIEGGSNLSIDFVKEGKERRLRPAEELALYRFAQEALNNVVRHAQANQASVRLAFAPEAVTLEVRDNGQGFEVPESPAEFAPGGHFGLLGLHERAELIGARLEIYSTPGGGTTVLVNLPLSKGATDTGGAVPG